jgi:hypothetical protein
MTRQMMSIIIYLLLSLFQIITYNAYISIQKYNFNNYHNNNIHHSIKNNNNNKNYNNNNNEIGVSSFITPRVRKQSKRDKSFVNILDSINYNRQQSSSSSSSIVNLDSIKMDPLIPLVEKIVKAADMRYLTGRVWLF